jgi:hypothetical protein
MADEKNIVDFGEWIVPNGWNDITLKKFQDIQDYYEGISGDTKFDIREVLHILCDKTIDEVNQLPSEFLDMILEKLTFLQEQPKQDEPRNYIKINGEKYSIHSENQLKTGEYIAADTVLKGDKNNIALLLAILCRKDGEIYDSKFENEIVPQRQKMFEEQKVMDVMPIAAFFLTLYGHSAMLSQLYSKVEEAINLTRNNIENSDKIGVFKRLYMRWRITRLQKSLKSINSISRTHSHSLRTLFRKAKWKKLKTSSRRH